MHILLFSDFGLPDSCANATRVFAFAHLLRDCGHRVSLLGVSYGQKSSLSGKYDGFDFEMLRALPCYGLRAPKRVIDLSRQTTVWLERTQADQPIDAIILNDIYYDLANAFLRFSKKHNIPLIVNAVEWYEKDNVKFSGLTGKITFLKNRIALIHIHKNMKNILAISSLLDDYYKTRGCHTITIPTIVDTKTYNSVARTKVSDRSALHIAYAGNPGKKDYVLNVVRALPLLTDEELKRLQFHFYGITAAQLCRLGISAEFVKTYKDNLVCHGKIPHESVKEKIADADFTVLLRPNLRYANAGFPTKVGESMACGTPVIANITSDLGRYIIDGKTGIVCADETAESCAVAIRKALQMTDTERETMRANTLLMAKSAFDYRVYAEAMEDFLAEL